MSTSSPIAQLESLSILSPVHLEVPYEELLQKTHLDSVAEHITEWGNSVLQGRCEGASFSRVAKNLLGKFEALGIAVNVHGPYLKVQTVFTIYRLRQLMEEDLNQGREELSRTFRDICDKNERR